MSAFISTFPSFSIHLFEEITFMSSSDDWSKICELRNMIRNTQLCNAKNKRFCRAHDPQYL